MLESLLGDANLQRLRKLVSTSGHASFEDQTARITDSPSKTIRYEAALTTGLYLSSLDRVTWDHDQAFKFAEAVGDGLLSLDLGTEREDSANVAEVGIACLHLLSSTCSYKLEDWTLLKLISFTDPRDPWTTEKAADVALDLLQTQMETEKLHDFIIGPVLQDLLKPLFANSSSRVTKSGRPAHYQTVTDPYQKPQKKPYWNEQAPWAISYLRWAVDVSEPSLFQKHWPLFTPVLLTIAEHDSAKVRARGLEILALFVEKCPPWVLHETGIGNVIEEASFPTLLYLPALTPEDESIILLVPAFRVLIGLAKTYEHTTSPERRRLLDKVLREGILATYSSASQYAYLVEILMENMESSVRYLGIYSIKHLKNLLFVISSVMEDPFALAYPPTILKATGALKATIAHCWPRVQEPVHIERIVRTLSLCWLNLHEERDVMKTGPNYDSAISQELLEISKMLGALWTQTSTKPPNNLAMVLEKEPRLANLFQTGPI